ncbi:MAG: hypothetical protein WD928_18605 [Gammaproteobacteria bacterium]
MQLATAFGSSDIVLALLLLLGGSLLELPLEYQITQRVSPNPAIDWFWEYLGAPLLRALLIVGFVLVAYPVLFGLRDAPTIVVLLSQGSLRLTNLVNVAFVLSLLLPLLPSLHRRLGLVLAIQGVVATAMVFGWYASWLGAHSIGPWPGFAPAAVVCGVALVVHHAAAPMGQALGHFLDDRCGTQGLDRIVPHAVALVAQAPTVLIYGYALGQQLTAY